jgi:hypothetical protein
MLQFASAKNALPPTGAPETSNGVVLKDLNPNDAFLIRNKRGIFFRILPYVDQQDLYSNASLGDLQNSDLSVYHCPNVDQAPGRCDYAGNAGFRDFRNPGELRFQRERDARTDGAARLNYSVQDDNGEMFLRELESGWSLASIRDGDSNTVALAERAQLPGNNDFYYHGYPSTDANGSLLHVSTVFSTVEGAPMSLKEQDESGLTVTTRAGGNHGDCGIVSFLDGSLRCISFNIDPEVWKALCGIADGKTVLGEEDPPRFPSN